MCLFYDRLQMIWKCAKNKKVVNKAQAIESMLFYPNFDFFCDL